MRSSDRRRAALAALLLLTACTVPTDESASVSISFVDPPRQVLVGETARLMIAVEGGFTPGPGDVRWTSSAPGVIEVDDDGRVTGIGEGDAEITARLTRFASAPPITHRLYASRGIVIDDIVGVESQSRRFRFGETARVRGLRLNPDSLVLVSMGGGPAEVRDYVPRDPSDPESLEELRIFIPIVASGSELLLVHRNGGSASRTLQVIQEDVLELAGEPYLVDLGPEGWVAPALTVAFPEEDLFRFRVPAGDWTLVARQLSGFDFLTNGTFGLLLAGQNETDDYSNTPWGRDHSGYACALRGPSRVYFPARRRQGVDEFVVPLRLDAPRTFDLRALTEADFLIAYRLEFQPGYRSDLAPDPMEGNDFCVDASPIEPGAARNANFDTGSDHDWYEFTVPGTPSPRAVRVRDESEPNDGFTDAEPIAAGDRIWGARNTGPDLDWFRFEAKAGQLIDAEVVASRLEGPRAGSETFSEFSADLRLYDAAGNLLEVGGLAEQDDAGNFDAERARFRGTDALVRWVAPSDGVYFLRVYGEAGFTNLSDVGDHMFYRLDLRLHDESYRVDMRATGASDPELAVVEMDVTDAQNTVVRTVFSDRPDEEMSELLPPGTYRLLAWPARGPGTYVISVEFGTPVNRPWPGAGR